MRPTLPCLCLVAAAHLTAAEVHWDGGAGTALWSAAGNWSGDVAPIAGDTVWLDDTEHMPSALTLDLSYPDTGAPISLVLAAGADLTLNALAGRELYLGSVTVADAQTYTLHVPRNGTQGASGTMPAAGVTWDIAAGGTLVVLEDFGSKALAVGDWAKTGDGTLRLGANSWSTLSAPRLTFRALGGVTEIGCLLGAPANGIAEVAEGATVRFTCYNPNATLMLSGSAVYKAGVSGLAGTLDLGGFDQRLRALSGSATGRVLGSGGIELVTLTLGVGDLSPSITRELDGAFAGCISDNGGRLRLVVQGGRDGYTQALSGANTYTGGTVVRGGTLALAHPTDTLSDDGALFVQGGIVDLRGQSETVGELVVLAGSILGNSRTLRAASLSVDNALDVTLAPTLEIGGPASKRGDGTLKLGGDLSVTEGLTIEGGTIELAGGTVSGNVLLLSAGLRGGVYTGNVHCGGSASLSGRVAGGAVLSTYMAVIQTEELVIEGTLQAPFVRFEGAPVTLNGTHDLVFWFGANTFAGGLTYGSGACVDMGFDAGIAQGYIDGTTAAERGTCFGAIDVGGAGLFIGEGARLRLDVDTGTDLFWLNPRVFKFASLLDGASITGSFMLSMKDGTPADGWSSWSDETGLYLGWAGRVDTAGYIPVPEASTLPWATALALTAGLARRRRQAKDPA